MQQGGGTYYCENLHTSASVIYYAMNSQITTTQCNVTHFTHFDPEPVMQGNRRELQQIEYSTFTK